MNGKERKGCSFTCDNSCMKYTKVERMQGIGGGLLFTIVGKGVQSQMIMSTGQLEKRLELHPDETPCRHSFLLSYFHLLLQTTLKPL